MRFEKKSCSVEKPDGELFEVRRPEQSLDCASHHPPWNKPLGKHLEPSRKIGNDPMFSLGQALQTSPCHFRRRL
jgi:hypothetical protein